MIPKALKKLGGEDTGGDPGDSLVSQTRLDAWSRHVSADEQEEVAGRKSTRPPQRERRVRAEGMHRPQRVPDSGWQARQEKRGS